MNSFFFGRGHAAPLARRGLVAAALVLVPAGMYARGGSNVVAMKAAVAKTTPAEFRFEPSGWHGSRVGTIDRDVLGLALNAAACAVRSGAVTEPTTLTVIDYSKPSTAKRLWVYDLSSRELLYEELVAHGRGSGDDTATVFSNRPESYQSSLGLFVTADAYVGRNGYSLRMDGLDRGFNDRARDRAIVIHGAWYVSAAFARANGRLGRSHGCPALRESVAREVIDRVKGGGLIFAYYPDPHWLASSKYLGSCT